LDSAVFLGSQLAEILRRFQAHVQDIREFLLKENLPVPSADAIPELSNRMKTDTRFCGDVSSLLRVVLYREREQVGYEDLLGILVAAAAGTEQDLTSDSQERCFREMLRVLLQSRRSTFRGELEESAVEEATVSVETEPRSSVPVDPEPVLVGTLRSPAGARKWESQLGEPSVAVAEAERESGQRGSDGRGPGDPEPPPFRAGELFAAQGRAEASWWRVHPAWIVGIICMLVGVGLGLMIHRVVSAAETHVAVSAADNSSAQAKKADAAAPKETPSPAGATETAPVLHDDPMVGQSVPPIMVGSASRPSITEQSIANGTSARAAPARSAGSSAIPMTVVKQVVTASAASASDSGGDQGATQITAATRSIVSRASAGVMPASVIFSPAPEYPPAASAARVHGEVMVKAVVDPDGNVIYARAVSGPPLLRDAAKEAVQRWRYRPLLFNGKPIAVTTTAILDFKFAK
jgi:TonB family protein